MRIKWAWHAARMCEMRNSHTILVREPQGEIPLGRYRNRWKDNIETDH
jgi:hypothetical protein